MNGFRACPQRVLIAHAQVVVMRTNDNRSCGLIIDIPDYISSWNFFYQCHSQRCWIAFVMNLCCTVRHKSEWLIPQRIAFWLKFESLKIARNVLCCLQLARCARAAAFHEIIGQYRHVQLQSTLCVLRKFYSLGSYANGKGQGPQAHKNRFHWLVIFRRQK